MNGQLLFLLYLAAGAIGTGCRVALSPTIEFGANKRTIVEVVVGGVSGVLLGHFIPVLAGLIGMPAETVTSVPAVVKACLVFTVSYAGSFTIGELLARRTP
jgi:hypothetical protein